MAAVELCMAAGMPSISQAQFAQYSLPFTITLKSVGMPEKGNAIRMSGVPGSRKMAWCSCNSRYREAARSGLMSKICAACWMLGGRAVWAKWA
jgi:hypothetical protein